MREKTQESFLLQLGGHFLVSMFCTPTGLWHNFASPLCVLYSMICFYYLSNVPIKREVVYNRIFYLAKYSMGIYALHISFLLILTKLWRPNPQFWVIQLVTYFILSLLMSFMTSFLIKKTHLYRNL